MAIFCLHAKLKSLLGYLYNMLYKAYYDFMYYSLIHTAFQGVVDLVLWLANHNVYEITENMYLPKVGEGTDLSTVLFFLS